MHKRQEIANERSEIANGQSNAPIARRSGLFWNTAAAAKRTVSVLGMSFDNVMLADAAADLVTAAANGRPMRVVFVNAHAVNCAWKDRAYWQTMASADCRFADGSGLAIAARMAGRALADNVNGTDMLPLLAAEAQERAATIFLLGGAPGRAEASAGTLEKLGFRRAIAGTHHGFLSPDSDSEQAAIDAINASGASIVLVGMGVPLQDQWIERNAHRLGPQVLVGVGGLFDFYSGSVSRAPALLRSLGLEWTWRLAQEPGRMWRRYIVGNVTFLARAAYAAAMERSGWSKSPAAVTSHPPVARIASGELVQR